MDTTSGLQQNKHILTIRITSPSHTSIIKSKLVVSNISSIKSLESYGEILTQYQGKND